MEGRRPEIESLDEWRKLNQSPEFPKLLSIFASRGIGNALLLEATKTTPVTRKQEMKGSDENMFLLPGEAPKEDDEKEKRKK